MKITKINLKKTKIFLRKLPRILGEKAFLFFLALLFLVLIFSGLVFYRYSFLIQKQIPDISQLEQPIQFKEKTYQDVLSIWQKKERRFQEAETKTYPNPFQVVIPNIEESTSTLEL